MNNIVWSCRLFAAALLAVGVAYCFRREWKYERQVALTGCAARSEEKRTTEVWLSPWILPFMMAAYWLIYSLFLGPAAGATALLEFSLHLLVLLSLYFAVLLLALPLLRRTISARACATLWLLPIFLYYNTMVWRDTFVPPLVVIPIPNGLAPLLLWIWLAGAGAVALWHLISHLRFRRRLLQDARPVEDKAVWNLWAEECHLALLRRYLPLLVSPAATSPLTIGLFGRTMCTVLPERDYTLDQYRLIFRHELRHVQRQDIATKCFYLLCKSLCWFNPLMWVAIRKASADLELSCDEMVVYGAEDNTRREYASLLLESAGDARGLTTCLSASASSLRRRLKGVVAPAERTSGTVVLGLIMAALVLCSGLVGVSTASGTAGELFFPDREAVSVQSVSVQTGTDGGYIEDPSPAVNQALVEELSALRLTRLATDQNITDKESPFLAGFLYDGEEMLYLELTDELCVLRKRDTNRYTSVLYRVDSPVDWEGLLTLVE